MRLLTRNANHVLELTADLADEDVPPYAILSHTWGGDGDEVTFADLQQNQGQAKTGYRKIEFCEERARQDGIDHFWIDTCCINKTDPAELSEAITSMFRWYRESQKCYVFLSDVSAGPDVVKVEDMPPNIVSDLSKSTWFTRGWTLQELLAPKTVEFFSKERCLIGTRLTLAQQIHEITTIPMTALHRIDLSTFSITERMRWTHGRQTKRKEDQAYCLLGIFDVFMPLIYGERGNAMRRLQRELDARHGQDVAKSLTEDRNFTPSGLFLSSAPLINPREFVGRSAEIESIHTILRPPNAPQEQRRVLLGGFGGVGKTQLAIAYARQYQDAYKYIFWLNATSESTLYVSYRQVAVGVVSVPDSATADDKQIILSVHQWLSSIRNEQWLLIFDNYDEPTQFDIEDFYPNSSRGSIIVTTRLPDLVSGQRLRLQPLQTSDESISILKARSGRSDLQNDASAIRLAQRLGGLPLALVTAGSCLRTSSLTCQEYLDAYQTRWQIDTRRPVRLQDYRDRTLYTTWNITYQQLQDDDPDAAYMLRVLAYFDHQDIWYALCRAGLTSEKIPTGVRERFGTLFADKVRFESIMRTLVEYCLIEMHHATGSYSIHSCVHDWTLGELNQSIDRQMYWYVFDSIATSTGKADWETLRTTQYARFVRHAARLTHLRFEQCDDEFGNCFFEHLDEALAMANMLRAHVQLSASEWMYVRALQACQPLLGPDRITTFNIMSNLGHLFTDQGEREKAEEMYTGALQGYESILGSDDVSTLRTLNRLGHIYTVQDRLQEAEKLHSRALSGFRKIVGPSHTLTLHTIECLAHVYAHQAKFELAEHLFQTAFLGYVTAHGPDHVLTFGTLNNLATFYVNWRKFDPAQQVLGQLLDKREQTLGPNHPTTLKTVYTLGNVCYAQGKNEQAEESYSRSWTGFEEVYGSFHASTLMAMQGLANVYSLQGRVDDAERMLTQALERMQKKSGPNDTSTLQVSNNLANIYVRRGHKLAEAEQIYKHALQEYARILGPDHSLTLSTMNNIGWYYRRQGRLDEAEQMYLRSLEGFAKTFGVSNLATLDTVCDYVNVIIDDDSRLEDTEFFLLRALAGYTESLGVEDARTREVADSLDRVRRRRDVLQQALS